ncbi:hypothetical protein J1614_011080 [Plenodomus biglobosus]|nr:hypothetical protein J1614_011080 [Plenodomus biglobosus]
MELQGQQDAINLIDGTRSVRCSVQPQSGFWLEHRSKETSFFEVFAATDVTGIDLPFRTTRNITVRRVKSSSSPKTSSISTAPPPRPAALPRVMHRYHSMPPQRFGNDERVFPNVRMPMSSTTRTSTLPTTHIDHVKLSQQSRRQNVSGAAQQQHQIDVRKARSDSLAALTAVYPEPHSLHHTSPPYLAKPYHAAMSSRQNHPASMQHRPKSTTHHRPPAHQTR